MGAGRAQQGICWAPGGSGRKTSLQRLLLPLGTRTRACPQDEQGGETTESGVSGTVHQGYFQAATQRRDGNNLDIWIRAFKINSAGGDGAYADAIKQN